MEDAKSPDYEGALAAVNRYLVSTPPGVEEAREGTEIEAGRPTAIGLERMGLESNWGELRAALPQGVGRSLALVGVSTTSTTTTASTTSTTSTASTVPSAAAFDASAPASVFQKHHGWVYSKVCMDVCVWVCERV